MFDTVEMQIFLQIIIENFLVKQGNSIRGESKKSKQVIYDYLTLRL